MILEFWNIWSLNLSFCGQLIKTSSYPGVLVTRTGEQEIGSVSGRLPDNPGELAYTLLIFTFILNSLYPKYDQLQISAYSYNAESLVIKSSWDISTYRSDEGLTLETSAFLPFTVANLRFQPSC